MNHKSLYLLLAILSLPSTGLALGSPSNEGRVSSFAAAPGGQPYGRQIHAETSRREEPRDRAASGAGLSLEAILALVFQDDPQGSSYTRDSGWGLRLGWDMSRQLGLGSLPLRFQPELSWTQSSEEQGTAAVIVSRRLDSFRLVGRLGWRLGEPSQGFRLIPFVSAGPAATLSSVRYDIADPVGRGRASPSSEDAVSELQWGAAYGAGLAFGALAESGAGLTGRLELLRIHRGYVQDLALSVGLGFRL